MTVQKFRSVEEMTAARVRIARDNGVDRFFRHCARYWAIAPRTFPRGVFRFRSIAEAQEARQALQRSTPPAAVPAGEQSVRPTGGKP